MTAINSGLCVCGHDETDHGRTGCWRNAGSTVECGCTGFRAASPRPPRPADREQSGAAYETVAYGVASVKTGQLLQWNDNIAWTMRSAAEHAQLKIALHHGIACQVVRLAAQSALSAALKAPPPDTEPFERGLQQFEQAMHEWTGSPYGSWADVLAARQALLKLYQSARSRSTAPHPDSVRLAKIRAEGAQFVVTGRDIYAAVPWPDGTRVIVAPLDWIDPNAAPNTTPAGGVEQEQEGQNSPNVSG